MCLKSKWKVICILEADHYCNYVQLFHMGRIPNTITFQDFRKPECLLSVESINYQKVLRSTLILISKTKSHCMFFR